jgi:hypothetical protein
MVIAMRVQTAAPMVTATRAQIAAPTVIAMRVQTAAATTIVMWVQIAVRAAIKSGAGKFQPATLPEEADLLAVRAETVGAKLAPVARVALPASVAAVDVRAVVVGAGEARSIPELRRRHD